MRRRNGAGDDRGGDLRWMIRAGALALCCAFSLAWYGSWDDIRKTAETVNSVKADFVQSKHMKILSRPLVSRGALYFRSPGSLRWEYRSPVKSVLMMSGGRVERYVKGSGGYVKDSSAAIQSMQVVVQEISRWMKGEFNSNPNFVARLKGGGRIVMVPKDASFSNIISRIELKLSGRPGVIESVRIVESEDAYTLIRFERVSLNCNLDDSLFRRL
ncbi:MAG: outer membrane lipoprotein carrier protein LolA [Spirochaetes bacterium]|nr:outer membrane lipoprotein carrier protein LolA [Spirochaetota bacterium]